MIFIDAVKITGGPEHHKRGFAKALKDALIDTARYWHRVMLPKHFQSGAENRYGYKPRSAKYLKRKRRKLGFVRPLYFTGVTERTAKLPYQPTGTAKGVKLKMQTPWYIRMSPVTRNAPFLGREITATTADEKRELERFLGVNLERRLNAIKESRTLRLSA